MNCRNLRLGKAEVNCNLSTNQRSRYFALDLDSAPPRGRWETHTLGRRASDESMDGAT